MKNDNQMISVKSFLRQKFRNLEIYDIKHYIIKRKFIAKIDHLTYCKKIFPNKVLKYNLI
jgi:hypothetical protein